MDEDLSRRGRGRYLWKVENFIKLIISERYLFFKGLLLFDEKNVFFGRYYTWGDPGGATDSVSEFPRSGTK
jgi:hypothetical protein